MICLICPHSPSGAASLWGRKQQYQSTGKVTDIGYEIFKYLISMSVRRHC